MTTTFQMVPAVGSWVLAIALIPCVALLGFVTFRLGTSLVGSQRSRFEVSEDGLTVRGDLYGRYIPRKLLISGQARVINLGKDGALRPVRRDSGIAIPGYSAGWFRLANGQKALVYVTDESRVVYVPTSDGYVVMMSALDADGLSARIRELAP